MRRRVHRGADHLGVAEVETAYVQGHLVPAERSGDHPASALAQQRHSLGHQVPGDYVQRDVHALGRGGADARDDVSRPVDDGVRARLAYGVGLRAAADGDHPGATGAGDLHRREPDAAGRARHQDGLAFAYPAAFDHAERRAVGGGQGGELVVGERGAGDVVQALQRGDDELGVTAVAFAAHQAHRVGVGAVAVVERRVDHHAAADETRVAAGAHGLDPAGHVGALDAGKGDGPAPARARLRVAGAAVGAFAGPQVGVVQGHHRDPYQCLAGPRDGHRHFGHLQHLRPPCRVTRTARMRSDKALTSSQIY